MGYRKIVFLDGSPLFVTEASSLRTFLTSAAGSRSYGMWLTFFN